MHSEKNLNMMTIPVISKKGNLSCQVIFGHSHDTKMDKDWFCTENRIYANCGYWCGFGEDHKEDNAHFVQTDGQTVELYGFNNGIADQKNSLTL